MRSSVKIKGEKRVKGFGNKRSFFIGKDAEGVSYWIEEPSWDCDWYWGFGYVQGYQSDGPGQSHLHFDGMFLGNANDMPS